VAHRLCLDFPNFVKKWVVLDIAPTKTMYDLTDREFATSYFWWFFFIQPYDFPERLIGSDPEYFLRHHINGQIKVDGSVPEVIFKEYLRTYMKSSTIHAICEDYRASATIDLEHDLIDAEERINAPLLALWGDMSVVGKLYDVKDTWQKKAVDVDGFGLPCGHSIPEECPKELVKLLLNFF
jgi:haloacetate dehalogenase